MFLKILKINKNNINVLQRTSKDFIKIKLKIKIMFFKILSLNKQTKVHNTVDLSRKILIVFIYYSII